MSFADIKPYLAAACALIGLISMVLPYAPARAAGVMLFVAVGPGLVVIRWFGTGDYRDLVLMVSFSLALHLVPMLFDHPGNHQITAILAAKAITF